MCFNLSLENKVYLNKVKGNIAKRIDKMNDSFIYFVEEFDKKYQQLGDVIIKKFNNMCRDSKGKYTPAPTMTPSSSGSRLSPFEDISSHHTAINIDNDSKSKSNSASNIASTEMVEKHYIDKKESFLDDAWDIIHGSD